MLEKIEQLISEISELKASSAEELEALRLKYLSKKGAINDLMADFRNVPAEQKREVGQRLNVLKQMAQDKISALKESFDAMKAQAEKPDMTRSAYPVELGTRHPLNIVKNEIIEIFSRLGFVLADGPEVEDDWHVFSAMNFAEDHPARDMQDTFFVEAHPDIILRTHTSSVQSRVMEVSQPPIRIICPGRVYRNEAISYRVIEGANLVVLDNEVFNSIKRKLLMSKDASPVIDSLDVELQVSDEKVDLYPTRIKMDRYEAIISGRHNIDAGLSCNYNVSVTQTPLPIRLGVTISGSLEDIANFPIRHIKVGKAKYGKLYRPEKSGAVEEAILRRKNTILGAARSNVRPRASRPAAAAQQTAE